MELTSYFLFEYWPHILVHMKFIVCTDDGVCELIRTNK